jgi:hypothetical protein
MFLPKMRWFLLRKKLRHLTMKKEKSVKLPIILAQNQFTFIVLFCFFLCVVCMTLGEFYHDQNKNARDDVRSNKKQFNFVFCMVGTCLLALLFDTRFVTFSGNIFIGVFFAVFLVIFLITLVIFSFWWSHKIGFKRVSFAQYAALLSVVAVISLENVSDSHVLQVALRELIFIILPLLIFSGFAFAHLIRKSFH